MLDKFDDDLGIAGRYVDGRFGCRFIGVELVGRIFDEMKGEEEREEDKRRA